MDDVTKARWQKLVDRFEIGKAGASPWDPNRLADNFEGSSHGERCSIAFLLNVWNSDQQWPSGKFDVIDALGIWDDSKRDAFVSWASSPWWP